jgi:hypothetical protein
MGSCWWDEIEVCGGAWGSGGLSIPGMIRGGQDSGASEAHPGVAYAMLLQPKAINSDIDVVNTDAL